MSIPQGDLALLQTDTAQRLLASTELARLAWVARDGTPRVTPMMWMWEDGELVMATFGGAAKIADLQANPAAAVTIDTAAQPPEVLLLRGEVTLTEVAGISEAYRQIHVRYSGEEAAAQTIAAVDRPGVSQARLALRPSWVGVLDFQTRLPGALARVVAA
jgi:hypothetical protein